MKSSELTYDQRQQLLKMLENKMGYFDYQNAVQVAGGEDELLDQLFAQAAVQQPSVPAQSKDNSEWSGCLIWLGIFAGISIISLIAGLIGGVDVGKKVFGTLVSLAINGYYFLMILGAILSLFKDFGQFVQVIVAIGLIGGALYFLVKLLTWIWSGTVDWFGWLLGHF